MPMPSIFVLADTAHWRRFLGRTVVEWTAPYDVDRNAQGS